MLFYVPIISPRIRYTFGLFFSTIVQADIELCDDPEQFKAYHGPKFSYGNTPIADELFFKASGLLFENNIHPIAESSHPFLFPVDSGVLDYDPFAAGFFMASRYEEYLPFKGDLHERFSAKQSWAQRKGFLGRAMVHHWSFEVLHKLKKAFPEFSYQQPSYFFQPSFDIDNAFWIAGRSTIRQYVAIAKRLLKGKWSIARELIDIIQHKQKDPFDTYEEIEELHRNHPAQYFFLVGNYGQEDQALDLDQALIQERIQPIAERVGIHPSYRSNTVSGLLNTEKKILENTLQQPLKTSRQHYLKLRLPDTYRQLLQENIQEDWSMGYADAVGFRAGMALPFFWYDLQKEEPTSLLIRPFMVMDQTLRQYLALSPEQALSTCRHLIAECKAVNGHFCTLWHNESLSERGVWKGWKSFYKQLITEAT